MSPAKPTRKIRLVIAEDHELTRYGLCMALEENPQFEILAEAEDGQQAVDLTREHHPDIVLMDIGMPVKDGIMATQELKTEKPEIKIAMLTSHNNDNEVQAAFAAGADAYCMKDIKIDRLTQVLEMVMDGALWVDPAIARVVMGAFLNRPEEVAPVAGEAGAGSSSAVVSSPKRYNTDLTDREMDVLQLIVNGKSNKEIAVCLGITPHTAKAHVGNIIQKLAVDDRTQVAVKALREGIV